ncbi:SUN domain-containing ossification factor isoform X1 [Polypterus senegalus]|uniref:SUN domain-containing ossification factor isoform X1 n=1 Tax=Polypterus senegalus TaxID=55291 RepID=UPI00196376DA|nr:SUN domain-containing ossification factor isoform X1 [Polypterus senegalus]
MGRGESVLNSCTSSTGDTPGYWYPYPHVFCTEDGTTASVHFTNEAGPQARKEDKKKEEEDLHSSYAVGLKTERSRQEESLQDKEHQQLHSKEPPAAKEDNVSPRYGPEPETAEGPEPDPDPADPAAAAPAVENSSSVSPFTASPTTAAPPEQPTADCETGRTLAQSEPPAFGTPLDSFSGDLVENASSSQGLEPQPPLEADDKDPGVNITDRDGYPGNRKDISPTPPGDIPTFDEWKKQVMEDEKEKSQSLHPSSNGGTHPVKKVQKNFSNYASVECGAKILAANIEAKSTSAILMENMDLYMLNPCSAKIWFVIELCEPIQVKQLDVANFELFSSTPKDFVVAISDRYPTSKWIKLGTFHAREERTVQSFPLDEQLYAKYVKMFIKYIKVELVSHFGSEHFCPLSLIRVFGTSMVEEYEESQYSLERPEYLDEDYDFPPGYVPQEDKDSKNLLGSATNAIMNMMNIAVKMLGAKSELEEVNQTEANLSSRVAEVVVEPEMTTPPVSLSTLWPDLPESSVPIIPEEVVVPTQETPAPIVQLIEGDDEEPSESTVTLVNEGDEEEEIQDWHTLESKTYCSGAAAISCVASFPEFVQSQCSISRAIKSIEQPLLSKMPVSLSVAETVEQASSQFSPEATSEWRPATPSMELLQPLELGNPEVSLGMVAWPPELEPSQSPLPHTSTMSSVASAQVTPLDKIPDLSVGEERDLGTSPAPPTVEDQSTVAVSSPEDSPKEILENLPSEEEKQPSASIAEPASSAGQVSEMSVEVAVEVEDADDYILSGSSSNGLLHRTATDFYAELQNSTDPSGANGNQMHGSNQKESVFMRLNNRIKALEMNMSLSSRYLEELSQRYRKQMEEMQRAFNKTIIKLQNTSMLAEEQDQRQTESIQTLQSQLHNLTNLMLNLSATVAQLQGEVSDTRGYLVATLLLALCLGLLLCLQCCRNCPAGHEKSGSIIPKSNHYPSPKRCFSSYDDMSLRRRTSYPLVKSRSVEMASEVGPDDLFIVEPLRFSPETKKKKRCKGKGDKVETLKPCIPALPAANGGHKCNGLLAHSQTTFLPSGEMCTSSYKGPPSEGSSEGSSHSDESYFCGIATCTRLCNGQLPARAKVDKRTSFKARRSKAPSQGKYIGDLVQAKGESIVSLQEIGVGTFGVTALSGHV